MRNQFVSGGCCQHPIYMHAGPALLISHRVAQSLMLTYLIILAVSLKNYKQLHTKKLNFLQIIRKEKMLLVCIFFRITNFVCVLLLFLLHLLQQSFFSFVFSSQNCLCLQESFYASTRGGSRGRNRLGQSHPWNLKKSLDSTWFCTIQKPTFAIWGHCAVHCFDITVFVKYTSSLLLLWSCYDQFLT